MALPSSTMAPPSEIELELTPEHRLDIIDVNQHVRQEAADFLSRYRQALYCSHHTTAGFLEESLCDRLGQCQDSVQDYFELFQELFPPGADYRHDQMHLRTELSPEQRRTEPRNADSHLTFIGAGVENCVTYTINPQRPVYFIDLDGVNRDHNNEPRRRRTTVIGFNDELPLEQVELTVPVSNHATDSVSLRDPRLGLFDQLHELLARYGISKGRVDIELPSEERHAGLTVNEYETLLMKHDLAEVLHDPLRFMARKGRNMLREPGSIPDKAKNYAKYDLVRVVNAFLDTLGLSESLIERVINKFLAVPAEHFLRMKRSVSLLVSEDEANGQGTIVQGRYQSPILVQWRRAQAQQRRLKVTLVRFE
ncbi:MAG: hypothetical protein GVY35_17230 [Bacteroidetes bacterium]|nr:hypothetical protein [Bacteroidota bacterium]